MRPHSMRSAELGTRLLAVTGGLFVFSIGLSLTLLSGLGLGPWSVLSDGLSHVLPMSFGVATTLSSVLVVAGAYGLGIRPALGTLMNMTLVGIFTDLIVATHLLPDLRGMGWSLPELTARLALNVAGVVVTGFATGLYLKGGLGAGPRDGLMLGLSQRLRRPIAPVRTVIEVTVLAVGMLLGGTAGLGTLLFAVAIGPIVGFSFRLLKVQMPVIRMRRSAVPPGPDAPPV